MDSALFLTKITSIAIQHNASDLHISPKDENFVSFRYRVNTVLASDLVQNINFSSYKTLANHIIVQTTGGSGVGSAIVAGSFDVVERGLNVSIRVSAMPTNFTFDDGKCCPAITLRIHNNLDDSTVRLSDLGISDYYCERLESLARLNQGLILVTGPTNSGKTTLLYAVLAEIKKIRPRSSIQTLEDPIERNMPGVDQFSINKAVNTTYGTGLMALLRQDLDVALIGEIRDEVAARNVTELAMTGHLVLSSLHANSALSSIFRLDRLNVGRADIADVLKTVMATRLVRKICNDCCVKVDLSDKRFEPYRPLINKMKRDNANAGLLQSHTYQTGKKGSNKKQTVKQHEDGCELCGFTGYRGMILVIEILTIDVQAQVMIAEGKTTIEIQRHLVEQGQHTLWHHGVEMLLESKTSLEELESKMPPYDGVF